MPFEASQLFKNDRLGEAKTELCCRMSIKFCLSATNLRTSGSSKCCETPRTLILRFVRREAGSRRSRRFPPAGSTRLCGTPRQARATSRS